MDSVRAVTVILTDDDDVVVNEGHLFGDTGADNGVVDVHVRVPAYYIL